MSFGAPCQLISPPLYIISDAAYSHIKRRLLSSPDGGGGSSSSQTAAMAWRAGCSSSSRYTPPCGGGGNLDLMDVIEPQHRWSISTEAELDQWLHEKQKGLSE